MDRSERRHHEWRMKAKYHRYQRTREPEWRCNEPADAGRFAHHGKPCSCFMCGNPRKFWGELTMQERRAEQPILLTQTSLFD